MHIVFAASECVPYAKTGGVADVISALAKEIVRAGHEVTVYLPLYRQVRSQLKNRKVAIPSITVPFPYYNRFVSVVDGGIHQGVHYYFLDCPELFDREFLYGTPGGEYTDNAERFGLFCRAALEASKQLGVPSLFHIHNWQASPLAILLRTVYYFDPVLRNIACLLTIHNTDAQGWFPAKTVEQLLLPWDVYTMETAEHYDKFNFLKGGIVYSDAITTVSRRYAQEIQTPELGNGLDGILRHRAADLHGILNGVDYSAWNPETDSKIAAHYTPEKLDGKAACRRDLLHAFGASHISDKTPVVGMLSRFATQKGFDLVAQAAEQLAQREMLLMALGTGEPYYENLFRDLEKRYSGRIAVRILFDDTLAHKMIAGADMLLMPSRYEPCGLSQIYSLKYGTVPVVHATGGLDDTIEEWDAEEKTGTGFKFGQYEPGAMTGALDRALGLYQNKEEWTALMRNGMARDHSWTTPAGEYISLYKQIVRRRS